MRKKTGFTLIELMICVIIISILMAIAIPAYRDMHERGKGAKAATTLDNIRTALTIYRDTNQAYPPAPVNLVLLQAVNPFPADDGDWTYSVTIDDPRSYTITATRKAGEFQTDTITMDQSGTINVPTAADNSWPP